MFSLHIDIFSHFNTVTTSAIEVVAQLVRLLINSNTPVSEEDLVEDYAPRDQDVLALQDAIVKSIGKREERVRGEHKKVMEERRKRMDDPKTTINDIMIQL